MKKVIFRGFVLMVWLLGHPAAGQEMLRRYIEEGLQGNLVLKEKSIGLEQGLLALREAKSWYYPSAGFSGDYTLAEGGRSIDIPVGDLLNPVYTTLNQLTGSNRFPQVSNASVQLMPDNFYDARIRLAWPLLNTDRHYNYRIRKDQVKMTGYEIETYRQELTRDIESAYYNYCLATDAIGIFTSALDLVRQNLRVNESLVRNGKGLPASVLRAESEAGSVASKLRDAEGQQQNARAWFNFLVNRPLGDTVMYESQPFPADLKEVMAAVPFTGNRSELKQLGTAVQIRTHELNMNRMFAVPRINLFADVGSQAFNWAFNGKSRYVLGGVQVTVPIFEGFRNRARIAGTRLALDRLELQRENTSRQFSMAAGVARNNLATAWANHEASLKQYESARAYFRLVEKGFSEGINSMIEFIDARSQYTASEIQVKLSAYRVLSAYSELKRQTASSAIQ